MTSTATIDMQSAKQQLQALAVRFGFRQLGVTTLKIAADVEHLLRWLDDGRHGEMDYMARHRALRADPRHLAPGTVRVLSVALDYWPTEARLAEAVLADPSLAYISRYALGRDYHRIMRPALAQLARALMERIGPFGFRVCVDTAPVLERAFARNAGLGWIGKHTNVIARDVGSYFFLGEILTDLPLEPDAAASAHCGSCTACMPACPTGAITAPFELDARRCISYLTIEHKSSIPIELRAAIGNRIYGCDDCQLVCPWNKFARTAAHPDFKVRHGLDAPRLDELFRWSESDFNHRMEGSAIRRIGFERFSRNLAVALGNAPRSERVLAALTERRSDRSTMVREHIEWALARHEQR